MLGAVAKAPPSMLYSTLNPATDGTEGNVNADAQVLAGAVMTGAVGNMTTFTVLLCAHGPVPGVPAGILPHADEVIYRATMEWQPGVVGIIGVAVNAPPSMLYWAVKPPTETTVGSVNAELQVFDGAIKTGTAG